MNTRPNILFLFTDDQRHDAIGCAGTERLNTPHMDALAASGARLSRCHIMGGTVGAVCCPSRAMVFTGRGLYHLEQHGNSIPEQDTLLGEHLRAHGYFCGGFGKWHNGRRAFARSFDTGEEIFFGGMADHWQVPCHTFDPSGTYPADATYARRGCHSTTTIADAATRFIADRQGNAQPWFASVHFLAPHDPRTMPEEFLHKQLEQMPQLPPNFMPEHPFDNGELAIRDEMLADIPRIPEQIQRHLAEYYAMIDHLDFAIGRILRKLDETGQRDNTIIVLAGDNGLALGQHGLMGKQSCYEHSLRIPFIIAGPGIPEGIVRDQLCYLHDLFPTLCELTAIPTPSSVQSQSLLPSIQHDAPHRAWISGGYKDCTRSIRRDDDWKLIVTTAANQVHTQLFHIGDDPWELIDHSDQPAHQATRKALLDLLAAATQQHQDFWQVPEQLLAEIP